MGTTQYKPLLTRNYKHLTSKNTEAKLLGHLF